MNSGVRQTLHGRRLRGAALDEWPIPRPAQRPASRGVRHAGSAHAVPLMGQVLRGMKKDWVLLDLRLRAPHTIPVGRTRHGSLWLNSVGASRLLAGVASVMTESGAKFKIGKLDTAPARGQCDSQPRAAAARDWYHRFHSPRVRSASGRSLRSVPMWAALACTQSSTFSIAANSRSPATTILAWASSSAAGMVVDTGKAGFRRVYFDGRSTILLPRITSMNATGSSDSRYFAAVAGLIPVRSAILPGCCHSTSPGFWRPA